MYPGLMIVDTEIYIYWLLHYKQKQS